MLRGAVVLAAYLHLPAAECRAQKSTDTVFQVHGSVVNGVTDRPIGRALVISQDRRLATMTNAEGQFSVDVRVPAASTPGSQAQLVGSGGMGANDSNFSSGPLRGCLFLLAQRPGFLESRQGLQVTLDASASTHAVVLRLMPAASISGSVSATGAEGLRGVRVQLLHRTTQDGRLTWTLAGLRSVNADGSFRIADLQPGEYTLVTSEWSPRLFMTEAPSAVVSRYAPEFLGDARTLDGAARLQLGYGQSARADLHLRPVPYYPITVPVHGLPANTGVNVRVAAGVGSQLYQMAWNARDGAAEGVLPDGDFLLLISAPGASHAAARVPIHVQGAAVVHAPVGLTPAETITVSVRDERTHTATAVRGGNASTGNTTGLFLAVRPQDAEAGEGGGTMQTNSNGTVLQNMVPGRYILQGNAYGMGYIASMTSDGVNLFLQPLTVNESGHTAPVEVVLRDDAGTISGTVDLSRSGLAAARVLILPTDGSGRDIEAHANGSGVFQAANVPPGSYRVVAMPVDAIETPPYRDPQAMHSLDGKGAAVTVTAGQTTQVQLEPIGWNGAGVQP